MKSIEYQVVKINEIPDQWRIENFPGGGNFQGGGANLLFGQIVDTNRQPNSGSLVIHIMIFKDIHTAIVDYLVVGELYVIQGGSAHQIADKNKQKMSANKMLSNLIQVAMNLNELIEVDSS